MANKVTKLPESWCWASIDQIGSIRSGQTPKDIATVRAEDGEIPWFRIGNMNETGNEEILQISEVMLTRESAFVLGLHIHPKGTVVFPKRGGAIATNKKRILGQPSAYDLNMMGILALELYDRYFWNWFQSVDLKQLSNGSNVPQINHGDIEPLLVPVPPLNEQRRIVAKIEALKARSQRVKEELEAIPALLDQFRQSVLAAAFRGELTADWREKNPDVEPAPVLLERIRAERRRRWEEAELEKMKAQGKTPKDDKWKEKYKEPEPVDDSQLPELPDGWCWAPVELISTKVVDGVHKKPNYIEDGIPFVTVKNLTAGSGISFKEIKYISPEDHEEFIKRANPERGDILISKDGTLGVVRVIQTNRVFSIFVSVALVKPVTHKMSNYLELAFSAPQMQRQMIGIGIGLMHIHLQNLRRYALPVAPLMEQEEIVNRINKNLRTIEKISLSVDSNQKNCDQLNQSILTKAFRGELVPQDPNDEPASVLLERIRAEREKLDTKKKTKGKTEKKSRKAKPEAAEPEQLSLPGFE